MRAKLKLILIVCAILIGAYFNAWAELPYAPHEYFSLRFRSVDDLIEWFETADMREYPLTRQDDFECTALGRYQIPLINARIRGNLIVPTFTSDNILTEKRGISVFPPPSRSLNISNHLSIEYSHSSDWGRWFHVVTSIPLQHHIEAYQLHGVEEFFLSQTGGTPRGHYYVSETRIAIHDVASGRTSVQTVQYVIHKFETSWHDWWDDIYHYWDVTNINFVLDGMHIQVRTSPEDYAKIIPILSFTKYPVTGYIPPRPTPTPTPPAAPPLPAPPPTLRFTIGTPMYTINRTPYHGVAAPFMDTAHNRVMIPLRTIADAFEMEANWLAQYRTAQVLRRIPGGGIHDLDFFHEVRYGYPLPDGMGMPIIHSGRVFLPLRYIAYLLNAEVRWDSNSRSAYIYLP